MCGIAGIAGPMAAETRQALLATFNREQAHRGPDGTGTWTADNIGLAHTRLAVIDLATGQQPMLSADGRYAVVLNGEIYNYKSLRERLISAGAVFRTHSDTEVIPAALAHWGTSEGLRQLRGMFAVAVYDTQTGGLTLARDPFGIKPLYVARVPGAVLFASEMKALLVSGLVGRAVDLAGILDFLTLGATMSPRTCWSSIEEVQPGTWIGYDRELTRSGERYHTPPRFGEGRTASSDRFEGVEQALLESCEYHLESDVPVGAFLSGGLDSSLLVAMLSRFRADLETFHVRFSEAAYDESPFARRVAKHCGVRYHEILVPSHQGTLDRLVEIVGQYDQPFGDSSAIPTWLVSREIAQHVKVAISGDGGDEVFGGYGRYRTIEWLRTIQRVPLAARGLSLSAAALHSVLPEASRRLNKLAQMSVLDPAAQLVALHTYLARADVASLFNSDLSHRLLTEESSTLRLVSTGSLQWRRAADQLIAFEVGGLLHGDYLRKVDIASSAHGLEVRTPMLDAHVAAVGFALPLSARAGRRGLKHALRVVASRYLPADVVQKPKWGFGVPFDTWLHPDEIAGVRSFLLGPASVSRDWLNPKATEQLIHRFERGGDRTDISRYQVYQRVFMLLSLETWLRRWRPTLVAQAA